MNSKISKGAIIWKMTRFTLRLILKTICVLIEVGFDSTPKKTRACGIYDVRYREEKGLISPLEVSKIIHD